jgi:hypothetical protein
LTEAKETKQERTRSKRPPVRLRLPPAALEKLSAAGIYCQPRLSLAYQKAAKRHVLRGVESGGAAREFGHYVAFCDGNGEPVAWLQPLQSITANGPHAVVIAPMLVSVEMFRVEQTYELIIARHEARSGSDGKPPFVFSQAIFFGRHGHLSLELWGRDREAAGEIAPEFFTHGGERNDIPVRFLAAVRAVTKGVTYVGCEKAQFARAPEAAATAPATVAAVAGVAAPASEVTTPNQEQPEPMGAAVA